MTIENFSQLLRKPLINYIHFLLNPTTIQNTFWLINLYKTMLLATNVNNFLPWPSRCYFHIAGKSALNTTSFAHIWFLSILFYSLKSTNIFLSFFSNYTCAVMVLKGTPVWTIMSHPVLTCTYLFEVSSNLTSVQSKHLHILLKKKKKRKTAPTLFVT